MKDYEKDYLATMATLAATLQKREKLDEEIESLHRRVSALETLIQMDDRHKGKFVLDQQTNPAEAAVNFTKPQVTERVKGLLMAANGPLTSGEIVAQLKQLGWTLGNEGQPLALVFGIGRRLTDQGLASRVQKNGKIAWVWTAKSNDLIASLRRLDEENRTRNAPQPKAQARRTATPREVPI